MSDVVLHDDSDDHGTAAERPTGGVPAVRRTPDERRAATARGPSGRVVA